MIIVLVSLLTITNLFGVCSKIDAPQEITAEWEKKVYGVNHVITSLDKDLEEILERMPDNTFDLKFIQSVKAHINKNPSGIYVEYWPNGQVKAKIQYQDKKAGNKRRSACYDCRSHGNACKNNK